MLTRNSLSYLLTYLQHDEQWHLTTYHGQGCTQEIAKGGVVKRESMGLKYPSGARGQSPGGDLGVKKLEINMDVDSAETQ